MRQPGVEPATARSQVQRPITTLSSHPGGECPGVIYQCQYIGPVGLVTDLPGFVDLFVLLAQAVWLCRTSGCQPSPKRAFPVVGPRIWNDLPADVTSAESLSTFHQQLKIHIFTKSFPGHFLDVK